MIDRANRYDKNEIVKLYNTCFPHVSKAYIQYYFDTYYSEDNTLVFKDNNSIIASLQILPFNIMLNKRYIKASMIKAIDVYAMYRNQGIMTQMLNMALDMMEHSELITLIQTDTPQLFIPFGFETVMIKQAYSLNSYHKVNVNNTGISHRFRTGDMLELYASFMKRFNGYKVRNEQDFINIINQVHALNGDIIFYYDHGNQLQGYATLFYNDNQVIIKEIVYMDSIALTKLINYALNQRSLAKVYVSSVENLNKLYPDAIKENVINTMARINDYDLFNRLYSCSIDSVFGGYQLALQPINVMEVD